MANESNSDPQPSRHGCFWLGLAGALLTPGAIVFGLWYIYASPARVSIVVNQGRALQFAIRANFRVQTIDTLRLYSVENPKDPMWVLRHDEFDARSLLVTYGSVPKDWEQKIPLNWPPSELVPGQKYKVVVEFRYNYSVAPSASGNSVEFEMK